MLLSNWPNWWDDWQFYWKVTFDGVNRTITVNPGELSVSVKSDIYSAWKQWSSLRDHSKFPPALRVIGGDPVGEGLFAGDLYFLTNDWKVVVCSLVRVEGALFDDTGADPFVVNAGGGVISTVSQLVQTSQPNITLDGDITVDVDVPTVQQIREEIDTNSARFTELLSGQITLEQFHQQTQAAVAQIPDYTEQLTDIQSGVSALPDSEQIAASVRTELTPELEKILAMENTGLSESQATMMLEMYQLLGLDPTKPLVVTKTARTAGDINQTIQTSPDQTVVSRNDQP